jgi:hypothetical protein
LEFYYSLNTKAEFHWFNPKIDLAMLPGINQDLSFEFGGGVGMSFLSYGVSRNELIWKFARLGVHIDKSSIGLDISPAMWNVASVMPIVDNLWLAPFYSLSTNRKHCLGMLLSVGL